MFNKVEGERLIKLARNSISCFFSGKEVVVEDRCVGAVGPGLLVLLGVARGDTEGDLRWLADKIAGLRIFCDENGKMNCSLFDMGGEVLVVSQFTLCGDCRKGRRPGFDNAAPPEIAEPLYERALELFREKGLKAEGGIFGAKMDVSLVNSGPVTFVIDTPERPH